MKELLVRVGVFQIASHPAVTIGDFDYLEEPVLPQRGQPPLSEVGREIIDIQDTLNEIRRRYLEWQRGRLTQLIDWVDEGPRMPDLLVFPECSIPLETLDIFRNFAARTKVIVLAGTHTPRLGSDSHRRYRKIGGQKYEIDKILNARTPPPAVLPILGPKRTWLHSKSLPGVFEITDIIESSSPTIKITAVKIPKPRIRLAPLVCAEALALPSYSPAPDLAAIIAFERKPELFHDQIGQLKKNKIPVALANDARFGGSGVFPIVDDRKHHWWFDEANQGRLPVGEYYVEVELDLTGSAVETGVSAPSQPGRLIRLLPILAADDPILPFEKELKEAAAAGDQPKVQALCSELATRSMPSPLVASRWRMVQRLLQRDNLSPEWLATVGDHIETTGLRSLDSIEVDLLRLATTQLAKLDEAFTADGLSDAVYGRAAKLRRGYEGRISGSQAEHPGAAGSTPSVLPIDREEHIGELLEFLTKGREHVLLLTGLEGIGKTVVLQASLAQADSRTLRVRCLPGTSADYLFEYLVKAAGRVPSGTAPRATFDREPLVEYLTTIDVLWLEDCHHLLHGPTWRTQALDDLFNVLIEAQQGSSCKIILESRREVPISRPLGVQILRRRIPGLPESARETFLDRQLKRAGVLRDWIDETDRRKMCQLVDGHPSLLIVCADACAKEEAAKVVQDIENRTGFYGEIVSNLLRTINPSPAERACMTALSQCRVPIPPSLLEEVVASSAEAVSGLLGMCLAERSRDGAVSLIPIVRAVGDEMSTISPDQSRTFHGALSKYFSQVYGRASSLEGYAAAVEANYHARLADLDPPCNVAGLMDELTAVARVEHESENYARVVALLEPIRGNEASEDTLAMLAEAYAWIGRYDEAFQMVEVVVGRNRVYWRLYIEACRAALRAGERGQAEAALQRAALLQPGHYRVSLFKGRLEEARGHRGEAIALYRESVERSQADGWPFFYLSRALIRSGQPGEALDVIEAGFQHLEGFGGGRGRTLEGALLQQELFALVLTDQQEKAQGILDILEGALQPRPETIICSAYVRAYYSLESGEERALKVFDLALAKLDAADTRKRHTRAQISLFRGKILELMGDLGGAEREFERACGLDDRNMHMKLCLMRVLMKIAGDARAEDDRLAAESAARKAHRVVVAILELSPQHVEGLSAQESLFLDFDLQ